MAAGCALELLEPEVQREILLYAQTPSDLHNLIRASPRLEQVFLLNKECILSAVARRQFHSTVLPEALIFAKVSQLERPITRETAIQHCQIDQDELQRWHDKTSSLTESVALCNLSHSVRFFIQDYVQMTLPIVDKLGKSLGSIDGDVSLDFWDNCCLEHPIEDARLSETETGRLQRAFCRFEIYRCIFARCSAEINHDGDECPYEHPLRPVDQAKFYLERFPDYQIIEINCIRDYLFRRLRSIFKQVEDEAVETLPTDTFIFDEECDVEALEWDCGFYLFTDSCKRHQRDHFEHLMSLGLPYIRRLFQTTGEAQRALFLRDNPDAILDHRETNFITKAIEFLGRNPTSIEADLLADTDTPFVYKVDPNSELDIPDTWQWAHPFGPPYALRDSRNKGLRDWGYVFWDHDRLHDSGILKHSEFNVRQIGFNEYRSGLGPSVQERLSYKFHMDELYSWGA